MNRGQALIPIVAKSVPRAKSWSIRLSPIQAINVRPAADSITIVAGSAMLSLNRLVRVRTTPHATKTTTVQMSSLPIAQVMIAKANTKSKIKLRKRNRSLSIGIN